MFEPTIKKIVLFIFIKYLAFYIFMMFKNGNYALIKLNELRTLQDVFYYMWIFLFLPTLVSILFTAPIYYAFKTNQPALFVLIIGLFFVAEYYIYTNLASQIDLNNGLYNAFLGLLVLIILFFNPISRIMKIKL